MLTKFRTEDKFLNLGVSNVDVGALGGHDSLDVFNHWFAIFSDEIANGILNLGLESRVLSEGASANIAETTEFIMDNINELEHGFFKSGDDHGSESTESLFGSDQRALDTSSVEGLFAEKFVRETRSGLEGHDVFSEATLDHIIEEGTTIKRFVFRARRGTATFDGVTDEVGVVVEEGEKNGGGFLAGGVVHTESFHALVGIEDHIINLTLEIRKGLLDMVEENSGHGLSEVFSTALVGDARVDGVFLEEFAFVGAGISHGSIFVNSLLRTVDDTNPSTTKRNLTTFEKRAARMAAELARSALAGETARMMVFSGRMNWRTIS